MTDAHQLEQRDTEARQLALDPTRSILLQAPAGSGKTTVLTQRILRLLATVDEPEQILAITFTRKAAGEMRERVFRALREEGDDSTAQGRRLQELAAAVRERSAARGWSLESSPGRLRIQTIDSLNRWLAQHLPLAARAIGDMSVTERPQALYRRAARQTLLDAESDARLQPDVELLFERLDNDFERIENLITTMLGARAHWLPRLLRGSGEQTLCERVEAGLRAIVAERLGLAAQVLPATLIQQGAVIARSAASHRHQAGESEGLWTVWLEAIAEVEAELRLPHWRSLCALALTGTGTWRSSLTKRDGLPTHDKPLKAAAQQWIADLSSVVGAQELLLELTQLPDPELLIEDAEALESLARLLSLAASELEVVFRESGRVDYPYIAAAARRALTDDSAPTDLALRLGTQIRHVLVDEFQDTSIEQFELLEALTADWDEGDGRTLFVVGDPMQSIYQFREAEVGLFLRTRERGLGHVRLTPLTLTRNFRSLPELVAWTNSSFPKVFPPRDDPRASAVSYLPSVASRTGKRAGRVELHRTRQGDSSGEAKAIADLILKLRAAEPESSVVILVSARTHAGPIARALHAAKLAVAGVDLVSLAEIPVVRDLTALTRALDHLGDRTAWLAVLRAPWCGLTLHDLTVLADRSSRATVWEALHDAERLSQLDTDGRARVARVVEVLEEALLERDRLDPAQWVERTWLRLGGAAACKEDDDLSHANAFFTALAEWSDEPDWTGPLALDERLKDLYADHGAAPADAVQIMTIHRAKGLEFDHVIVPGLGRRMRGNTEPLLRWLELPSHPHGSDLLMAPITPSDRREPELLNLYLKSLQARRALHERARLLYVAATRARTELHLFGDLPDAPLDDDLESSRKSKTPGPPAGTLLATLWPAIASEFPQSVAVSAEISDQLSMPFGDIPSVGQTSLTRLPPNWQAPAIKAGPAAEGLAVSSYEPPRDVELVWPVELADAVCAVTYDFFCRLTRRGHLPDVGTLESQRVAINEKLSLLGIDAGEVVAATERVLTLLTTALEHDKAQWLFARSHIEARHSVTLTGVYEGRLASVSIDHVFVDEQRVRWVIGVEPGLPTPREVASHREQVLRSMSFARILGEESVRGAVYFPCAQLFAEFP